MPPVEENWNRSILTTVILELNIKTAYLITSILKCIEMELRKGLDIKEAFNSSTNILLVDFELDEKNKLPNETYKYLN